MKLIRYSNDIRRVEKLKNERGYTLILVLILISVITIFALAMSGMAVSTRLQFNKSDERNKATDIAEMGITYYKTVLDKLIVKANASANQLTESYHAMYPNATQSELNNYYDANFSSLLKANKELQAGFKQQTTIETGKTFEISFTSIDLSKPNMIVVKFFSKGQTAKEAINLSGIASIQKSTTNSMIGQPIPTTSSFSTLEADSVNLTKQNKDVLYTSSTYFTNDIQIQGSRVLTVQGNAFIAKTLYLQGSADIIISGDAIFQNPIITTGNANNICISGNTYLVSQNKLVDYPLPENSCAKAVTTNWGIDLKSGLNVTY